MPHELEFEDDFGGDELDLDKWIPYYLPQWSSLRAGGGAVRDRRR